MKCSWKKPLVAFWLVVFCCGGSTTQIEHERGGSGSGMAAVASPSAVENAEVNRVYYPTFESRNDGEYRTCVLRYQVNAETIIRTQDSKTLGARYINETELPSQEECLLWCCQTDFCNVAIFEKKDRGSCYLFDCGPPNDFKCKFAAHHQYTSAILDTSNMENEPGQMSSYQHKESRVKTGGVKHVPPHVQPPMDEHIAALKSLKHQQQQPVEVEQVSTSGAAEVTTPTPSTTSTTTLAVNIPSLLGVPKQHVTVANDKEEDVGGRCSNFQFQCRTSRECIAVYNACDGIPQCADGSDEGDELGCPPDGRRFGSAVDSTVTPPVEQLRPHKQPLASAVKSSSKVMDSPQRVDEERHHKQMESEQQMLPFEPVNKAINEQQSPAFPYTNVNDNVYQPPEVNRQQLPWPPVQSQSKQNELQQHQQQQQSIARPETRVNEMGNNGQQRIPYHQVMKDRNRYNSGGHSYQHLDDEQTMKSRPHALQSEGNPGGSRNHQMYNQQQAQPIQYNSESDLVGPSYDGPRNYQGPQQSRTYSNEFYEGGDRAVLPPNPPPPAPNAPESHQNNFYKPNNYNQEPGDGYRNNKNQKESSNGNWAVSSNRQQQPQTYEDRNRINSDVNIYQQYPEADIGPAHVHIETHRNDAVAPVRGVKILPQDKHQGPYNVNGGGNDEVHPPNTEQDPWDNPQPMDKVTTVAMDKFHHGLHVVSSAQKTSQETTTSTTHRPTTTPPGHTGGKTQQHINNNNKVQSSIVAIKALPRIHELELTELDSVHVQRSSESSGAIVALTLGLSITGLLLVLVGCRLRMVRRRLRKGRGPYAHDADYLVNGMYL